MIQLKPVKQAKQRDTRFAVCDIEATRWINFLTIGYYDGETFHHFEKMENFFKHLEKCEPIPIFAHFGGKYDFSFLFKGLVESGRIPMKMIPRGNGFLSFEVVIGGKIFSFRDSSAMLPCSLRELCKNFNVEHPKLDIDYEKITKVTRQLIRYLEFDCRGLYECIAKYYDWPLIQKAGPAYTIAGQAVKIFQTFMHEPIPSLGDNVDAFVRSAYFGGRTEIFKPLYLGTPEKPVSCFDVNSLYPTVMLQNSFPVRVKGSTTKLKDSSTGFFDVEVEVKDSEWIPPLGTVFEVNGGNKFIFPTGRFRGRWSSIELQYAESIGVKIRKVYSGYEFHKGENIFEEFIDHLYKKRLASESNSVDNILCKLIMNSTYGRFGLNKNRENISFDDGSAGLEPWTDIKTKKGTYRLAKRKTTLNTFTNVAIAAWVTSHARIFMHKIYRQCGERLYYTDTDSIFTTKYFKNEKGLGGLKHEYSAESACFLLPKTYVIDGILDKMTSIRTYKALTMNEIAQDLGIDVEVLYKNNRALPRGRRYHVGTTIFYPLKKKIVMKGFDKKKISHFGIEDFKTALEGDLRRMTTVNSAKFATFKTAARKGKFLTMVPEAGRSIRSSYDKRRTVRDARGDYTTEPLNIKNGIITNLATSEAEIYEEFRNAMLSYEPEFEADL